MKTALYKFAFAAVLLASAACGPKNGDDMDHYGDGTPETYENNEPKTRRDTVGLDGIDGTHDDTVNKGATFPDNKMP